MAQPADRDLVVSLCLALTKYLHALKASKPQLANSIFVCAACTDKASQYQGLAEIFLTEHIQDILRTEITSTRAPTIMRYCYQLGRLRENLDQQKREGKLVDDARIQELFDFAESIGDGSLYDLFDYSSPPYNWLTMATFLMRTLELVSFEQSILARYFDREPLRFFEAMPVQFSISKQIKADPIFHYGWICEELLFASRMDLHFCYLPPPERVASKSLRWALCLWTDRSASLAFKSVSQVLERKIRSIWPLAERIQTVHQEAVMAEETDKRWRTLYNDLMSELKSVRKEATEARDCLMKLDTAYWVCGDFGAREECLKFIEEMRRHCIAESLPFDDAVNILVRIKE